MPPILEFKNITKEFGPKIILDNISFKVEKGEIFGIIGMSGSGKTTLLNVLISFLKPSEGEIFYQSSYQTKKGAHLKKVHQNLREIRQMFGFAPQAHSFYPKLTVEENLIHFGSLYRLKKNMDHLLELTQLLPHKKKLAEHLSGGMQRRLSIICSLVHQPDILILDEPTADLDPILREETWDLIKQINDHGTTVIVASHFLEELENVCDRIALLHNGFLLKPDLLEKIKKKYTQDNEEIHLEIKGDYNPILKKLNKNNIAKIKKGKKLIIYTPKSREVLYELARILKTEKVKTKKLEVHKATLKEVFEFIEKEVYHEKYIPHYK